MHLASVIEKTTTLIAGVRPEQRVAILMERSADLVVAVLAVLEAGGSYLPLDLRAPVARLSHTLSEALHTMGHRVIELGGEIVEMPGITGGSLAVRNAALFQADKLFFSTVGLSEDGRMLTGIDRYDLLLSTMIRCSQKRCFLLDHDKFPFVTHPGQNLVSVGSLEGIDTVVSDCEFPEAFTSRFPRTEFRFVTPCKE